MLLTPSLYTRQQTPIKVTKIAIHYVGNPNSSALANRNYFESLSKSKKTKASSHYIIGLDGEIIRCIPENEQSICTNSANPYALSIECCHPDSTGKFNDATYNALVELCVDICKRYGLNPLVDIIRHYDVTGKICPKWFVDNPREWDLFKSKVKVGIDTLNKINEVADMIYKDDSQISKWANTAVYDMRDKGIMIGSDNEFNPKGEVTREVLAQTIYNLLKYLEKYIKVR